MKKLKQLSAIGFALTLIFTSCSIEKRHYMSGYYISHPNNGKIVKDNAPNSEIAVNKNKTAPVVITKQAETVSENNSQINESNLTASTDKSIIFTSAVKFELDKKSNTTITSKNTSAYEEKAIVKAEKRVSQKSESNSGIPVWLYVVLAILIPFVAVGLATDWGIEVLWNILWTLLCGIPGIIHAFIILKRKDII